MYASKEHIKLCLEDAEKRFFEWHAKGKTYCHVTYETIAGVERTYFNFLRLAAKAGVR